MQKEELQEMTVVQLRKLAKDNKISLGSGLDKASIIEKLLSQMAEQDAPAAEPEPVKETETKPEASAAVDVTYAPGGGYHMGWQAPARDENAYGGYKSQAWAARTAAQRTEAPRPAWQASKPVGTASRFGPQTRTADETPGSGQQTAAFNEPTVTSDGYRLGYRAAPQRQSYGSRQEYASRDSYGAPRQSGYHAQTGYHSAYQSGGYQQPAPQPLRGYQQPGNDPGYNDAPYRMARDPQFQEQAENDEIPSLLQLADTEPVEGILEILPDGYGFLRGKTLLPGKKDVYVSAAQIHRFGLRTGDSVSGSARLQRESDRYPALMVVDTCNGAEAEENTDRILFEEMAAVYPTKRISLEIPGENSMAMRLADLIAPIGYGQRVKIICPPYSGCLTLFREMSRAIVRNDPEVVVMMLLIDINPEELTEIRESTGAEVFAATFADPPETQTRVSETMLERAERLVENGKHVVILLDSLTKLTRAYQSSISQGGRPITNAVTPAALVKPKKFFGAARNTREGGSLTVIATIAVGTGSRVDDIIYEEFRGTANSELVLCTHQESDPVFPMIDLQNSGTRKEDNLLSDEQKEGLRVVRQVLGSATNGEAVVQLISMMQKTKCNQDLLNKLKDWIVLWQKSGFLKQ